MIRVAHRRIFLKFLWLLCWPLVVQADPIYVYRDGNAIRFSNKAPPPGVKAEVFTARGPTFSVYRNRGSFWKLRPEEYRVVINRIAIKEGVDPHLVRAVIHAESGFNPRAVSPAGARGLMQLMPDVARSLGVYNSFDPVANIEGGVKHLAFLLRKYDGNQKFALAAYNAGQDAVKRYKGIPPYNETREYVSRVLELKARYSRHAG